MVFFTCNQCGDSLKKNKVDQHFQICSTTTITCMDCFKDFRLNNYNSHNECITEDQKYGGPNSKQQDYKGKNKQNEWIMKIKSLVQQNSYPKEINSILNALIKYENIPRKKTKFVNFIRNSFRIRNENLVDKIWSIFEEAIKNRNSNHQSNGKPQNGHPNDNQEKSKDDQMDTVNNEQPQQQNDQMNESNDGQVCIKKSELKQIVISILDKRGSLTKSKLQKKILRKYHKNGHDEQYDCLIMNKLDKILTKKKFIIDKDVITLNNEQ
ncbi:LYAR-type C2HC zinc finger containing protein [Euroglyphus maynei]|uniref:LYAR-type C2HC zinc finger containing protein n=1 Tax=Euroglyphus maynei TaxID=6958 RepID=A0A1Y3B6M8_EURMA|nr:LYAR-type C2HC zinc finger containing protein [Euroglyphus maynei]